MKSKTIFRVFGFTLCFLTIPGVGMLLSDEINWGPEDFLVAGSLIFGLGVLLALARQYIINRRTRITIIALGVLVFLLLWIELAVGVFGSSIAGN